VSLDAQKPKLSWQFLRYVIVGGFNTLFGYGVFALLNWSFTRLGSWGYMYAAVLANPIAITVAFLGYKWFVFRTRGNYIVEWLRCLAVYGTTMLIGLVSLPILVMILQRLRVFRTTTLAAYVAYAITTVVTVLFSFFGHSRFSFRTKPTERDLEPSSK
jgi:putative flippase GtrA